MPIYEYECESCGHITDALQKVSDPPLVDCPACGQPRLRKLISAPNFRLKGSGWYETDFKTGNKKNLAGDTAATPQAGGGDAGKDAKAGKDGGDKGKTASDKPAASSDGRSADKSAGKSAGKDGGKAA